MGELQTAMAPLGADSGARPCLDSRLRRLTYDDVVDWMGERFAGRAWNYRERVRDVYVVEDGYVATVEGSELYAVKLTADPCGEFESVCSCPIGGNCKHAGALVFVASERLKCGNDIETNPPEVLIRVLERKREERRAAARPSEPPPKPRVRVVVDENPFGRFTAAGGRHARNYSFRIVSGERVYHWSFILSTLMYLSYARVCVFLDELPIREPDQSAHEFRYWLERGIHDGNCCLDDRDRLVALRVVMLSARKTWCD